MANALDHVIHVMDATQLQCHCLQERLTGVKLHKEQQMLAQLSSHHVEMSVLVRLHMELQQDAHLVKVVMHATMLAKDVMNVKDATLANHAMSATNVSLVNHAIVDVKVVMVLVVVEKVKDAHHAMDQLAMLDAIVD